MARAWITTLMMGVALAAAAGDELLLRDGRTLTGVVTVRENDVEIKLAYGALTFPKEQVLRVEFKQTPEAVLAERLAETASDDVEGLFAAAQWAGQNALPGEAQKLYAQVLRLRPDHAGTRRELGHVKIDGQWRALDVALELARGKLEAGQYDSLLADVLPAMEQLARSRQDLLDARQLTAQAQLRSGRFAEAAATFKDLAEKSTGPQALRHAATAEVLQSNPDGMYLLGEPYPPKTALLGGGTVIPPGPASLSEPLVLEAALRDLARKQLRTGQDLLEAGRGLEASDPAGAVAKYQQASAAFDRADALTDGVSRSYRVELIRRRIASVRQKADAEARKFDETLALLGKQELTPQAYRAAVRRLMGHLDEVRDNLKIVLAMAQPYPRDLLLEIQWAEVDLKKTDSMRDVLTAELGGER